MMIIAIRGVIMISSIVWLILLHMGYINPDSAPWEIYLPIAFIECIVYLLSLPKIAEFVDKIRSKER